jgi:hypothetical protein
MRLYMSRPCHLPWFDHCLMKSINYEASYYAIQSRDSSVCITLGYGLDDRGSRVWFPGGGGVGIFFFTTESRTALETTQPPVQWVPVALSLRVKRSNCGADHSLPSSAEVKNAWSYTSSPQYAFMAWCSVKAQGQLYLLPLSYLIMQLFPIYCHFLALKS